MKRAAIGLVIGLLAACGSKKSAEEEAKQQAAELDQKAQADRKAAGMVEPETVHPPVRNSAHIPCSQLIDPAAFGTALGEKDPVTVTEAKGDAEAAASCDIVRGGKALTTAEQTALLKKQRRLGVMAGDPICNVTAYCWTIEDADKFKASCKSRGMSDNEDDMGSFACRLTVAQGADDVYSYMFFDADTKCVLKARGGPSMVDNTVIATCAKAARDLIGPTQIAVSAGK